MRPSTFPFMGEDHGTDYLSVSIFIRSARSPEDSCDWEHIQDVVGKAAGGMKKRLLSFQSPSPVNPEKNHV